MTATKSAELERIAVKGYAHPEVLVTTAWLADRLGDPSLRII